MDGTISGSDTQSGADSRPNRPILTPRGPRARVREVQSPGSAEGQDLRKSEMLRDILRQSSPQSNRVGSRTVFQDSRISTASHSHGMAASNDLLNQLLGRSRKVSDFKSSPTQSVTPLPKTTPELEDRPTPVTDSSHQNDHKQSLLSVLNKVTGAVHTKGAIDVEQTNAHDEEADGSNTSFQTAKSDEQQLRDAETTPESDLQIGVPQVTSDHREQSVSPDSTSSSASSLTVANAKFAAVVAELGRGPPEKAEAEVADAVPSIKSDDTPSSSIEAGGMSPTKDDGNLPTVEPREADHEAYRTTVSSESSGQSHRSPPLTAQIVSEVPSAETESKGIEVADSWESAESVDDDLKPTYLLPQRKDLILATSPSNAHVLRFDPEAETQIVGFKRAFDDMDRNLIGVTNEWIVYVTPKNILRMIRWDDACDFLAFSENRLDRLLSISVSHVDTATHPSVVIATGLSGKLYISTFPDSAAQELDDARMRQYYLTPPELSQGPSQGEVRTRAKFANSINTIFAFSRGKYLFIRCLPEGSSKEAKPTGMPVSLACQPDEVSLMADRAIKDFAFSPDDSILVTMDKSGKLAAWDIREPILMMLYGRLASPMQQAPIMSWLAAQTDSDMRPTSVRFMSSPWCLKTGEVRGLIVGLKNNHVIQVWNLDVGRPVLEIRLPQTTDSERLCVIDYESESSVIVIGHPGRQSIFFVHLNSFDRSAYPDQATYFVKLDPRLPQAADRVMGKGFQEFSIATVGSFQSLQVLPPSQAQTPDHIIGALFVVYVLGSKAARSYVVTRSTLGQGSDGTAGKPRIATDAGMIEIAGELAPIDYAEKTEQPILKAIQPTPEPEKVASPVAAMSKKALKKARLLATAQPQQSPSPVKKPKWTRSTKANEVVKSPSKAPVSAPQQPPKPQPPVPQPTPVSAPSPSVPSVSETAISVPHDISTQLEKILAKEMQVVSQHISQQLEGTVETSVTAIKSQLQAALKISAGDQKGHLTNVVKNATGGLGAQLKADLKVIMEAQIQSRIIPALSATIQKEVQTALSTMLPREIRAAVEGSLPTEITDPASTVIERTITEVAHFLPGFIQAHIPRCVEEAMLKPQISDALSKAAVGSFAGWINDKVIEPTNKMYAELVTTMDQQSVRVAEAVTNVTESVRKQSDDIAEIRSMLAVAAKQDNETWEKLRSVGQEVFRYRIESREHLQENGRDLQDLKGRLLTGVLSTLSSQGISPIKNQAPLAPIPGMITDLDYRTAQVSRHLKNGQHAEAIAEWIGSEQRWIIFEKVLVKYNPWVLIDRIPPLLLLNALAAVTEKFETYIWERLHYTKVILTTIDAAAPITLGIIEKVLYEISERLHDKGSEMAKNQQAKEPYLRQLSEDLVLITQLEEQVRLAILDAKAGITSGAPRRVGPVV